MIQGGTALYNGYCLSCHGINAVGGPLPDLRYTSKAKLDNLEAIVLGGALKQAGMPAFDKILNADQVGAIRAYLISRAQESAAPHK